MTSYCTVNKRPSNITSTSLLVCTLYVLFYRSIQFNHYIRMFKSPSPLKTPESTRVFRGSVPLLRHLSHLTRDLDAQVNLSKESVL